MRYDPDGRVIFTPTGRNAQDNLCILADCISEISVGLFSDQDTALVMIEAGARVGIGPSELRELIRKHVVTQHAVETNGIWTITYKPVEPEETDLRLLTNARTTFDEGGLIWRVPPMPYLPLGPYKERQAKEKLQRGEPISQIARQLGTSVEMIKALGHQQPVAGGGDNYRYTR